MTHRPFKKKKLLFNRIKFCEKKKLNRKELSIIVIYAKLKGLTGSTLTCIPFSLDIKLQIPKYIRIVNFCCRYKSLIVRQSDEDG